jgi:hypothetical protein
MVGMLKTPAVKAYLQMLKQAGCAVKLDTKTGTAEAFDGDAPGVPGPAEGARQPLDRPLPKQRPRHVEPTRNAGRQLSRAGGPQPVKQEGPYAH